MKKTVIHNQQDNGFSILSGTEKADAGVFFMVVLMAEVRRFHRVVKNAAAGEAFVVMVMVALEHFHSLAKHFSREDSNDQHDQETYANH